MSRRPARSPCCSQVNEKTLHARVYAGMTTPELTTTLVNANNNLVAKLKPACIAHRLWPDATPKFVEVELICTAYNGHAG
jgi:hypothetical protein